MPCNAPAASRGFPDWLRPAPLTGAVPVPAAPPRGRPAPGTPRCSVVAVGVVAPLRRRVPVLVSVLRPVWGSAGALPPGSGAGAGGRSDGAAVHRCGARPVAPGWR